MLDKLPMVGTYWLEIEPTIFTSIAFNNNLRLITHLRVTHVHITVGVIAFTALTVHSVVMMMMVMMGVRVMMMVVV